MSHLKKLVLVKLPDHFRDLYNRDNAALPPIGADDQRPALVVGESVDQVQQIRDGNNPDGSAKFRDQPLDDTVNLLIFHDGPLAPHYVQAVPVSAISDLDGPAETEPTGATDSASDRADTGEGKHWDSTQEGNGTTYVGTGPYSPTAGIDPSANVQPPAPGTPVAGGSAPVPNDTSTGSTWS